MYMLCRSWASGGKGEREREREGINSIHTALIYACVTELQITFEKRERTHICTQARRQRKTIYMYNQQEAKEDNDESQHNEMGKEEKKKKKKKKK